ncbi:MAG: heavy-metal-associated domain-containing protein [Novosphingobium sp.]
MPQRRSAKALWVGGALACAAAIALIFIGPARLLAQIEGERGIAPLAVSHDIEVSGITVNTTGKTAQEARMAGWAEARRKAWEKIGGPQMADGQLDSMVSAVVVEREQIGPHRYIATLGVIFDRTRAGQFVGGGDSGQGQHSAPMLTLPILYSGGAAQVFEVRGPWQAAWAQFNAGASTIDYVRPSGSGGDSLLLTAGQSGRRSRLWWGNVLDQFSASDVIMPVARLERQWPGGPVAGHFTARFGPDDTYLGSFDLNASDEAHLPQMLAEAVVRMDRLYTDALISGRLRPDPTLNANSPALDPAIAALITASAQKEAAAAGVAPVALPDGAPTPAATPTTAQAAATTIVVQFASPDARAVDSALGSVRSVPGVRSVGTSSLAMGGTSVMRVTFAGTQEELRAALSSRGWSVSAGNGALSIRR